MKMDNTYGERPENREERDREMRRREVGGNKECVRKVETG